MVDGQWVQAFVTLEASAWDFWNGFDLYVTARNSSDVIQWQSYGLKYMDRTNQFYASPAITVTLATVPFQVTAAMTKFQFQVEAYPRMQTATGNATLKISRPFMGTVPSPP